MSSKGTGAISKNQPTLAVVRGRVAESSRYRKLLFECLDALVEVDCDEASNTNLPEFLLSPFTENSEHATLTEAIKSQLRQNVTKVIMKLKEGCEDGFALYEVFTEGCCKDLPFTEKEEPIWAYTLLTLFVLVELGKEFERLSVLSDGASGVTADTACTPAPIIRGPADLLSLKEQATLRTVMSFFFPIGVLPFLHPSVQEPMLKCTRFGRLPKLLKYELSNTERQTCLSIVMLHILRLRRTECLWIHICFKHLVDLVLSLTQLGWGPGAEHVTAALYKEVFASFVENAAPPPMIVEALMLERSLGFSREKPPPRWLNLVTTQYLNKILLGPNGAYSVMCGFLDPSGADLESQAEEKCRTVAGLFIGMMAKLSHKRSWEILCAQFLNLLNTEKRKTHFSILRIICLTITSLYADAKHRENTEKHFFRPLFAPIHKLTDLELHRDFTLPESALTGCINRIHAFFYPYKTYPILPTPHLLRHFSPLMYIGAMARHLRSPLEHLTSDLISCLITHLHVEEKMAEVIIPSFLHVDRPPPEEHRRFNPNLEITLGPVRGLILAASPSKTPCFHQDPIVITQLLAFVRKGNTWGEDALCDLFIEIIKEVYICLTKDDGDRGGEAEGKDPSPTTQEEFEDFLGRIYRKQGIIVHFLSEIQKQPALVEKMLSNPQKGLSLFQMILEGEVARCEKGNSMGEAGQSVDLALSVLKSMSVTADVASGIWDDLRGLMTPLKRISEIYPSPSTRSLAAQVHSLILTHGLASVNSDDEGSVAGSEEAPEAPHAGSATLDSASAAGASAADERRSSQTDQEKKLESFDDAMKHIMDPVMPVQVHGFMVLTKLLKARDPKTLEHREELLVLYMTAVKSADSYVYLPAIDGLATLADAFPDEVVPLLCNEYADFESRHPEGSDAGFEIRAKVGEGLVRAVECLGPLAPKFREELLRSLLFSCKKLPNSDPFLRSSAAACLGKVVGYLKHGCGTNVQEVMNCLDSMCRDSDILVVKGALTGVLNMLTNWQDFPLEKLKGMAKTFSHLNRHSQDPSLIYLCREVFEVVQVHLAELRKTPAGGENALGGLLEKTLYITTSRST